MDTMVPIMDVPPTPYPKWYKTIVLRPSRDTELGPLVRVGESVDIATSLYWACMYALHYERGGGFTITGQLADDEVY